MPSTESWVQGVEIIATEASGRREKSPVTKHPGAILAGRCLALAPDRGGGFGAPFALRVCSSEYVPLRCDCMLWLALPIALACVGRHAIIVQSSIQNTGSGLLRMGEIGSSATEHPSRSHPSADLRGRAHGRRIAVSFIIRAYRKWEGSTCLTSPES